MSDLISRQAAIEAIEELVQVRLGWRTCSEERKGLDAALCAVIDLPSAKPERKNGRWVYYSKDLGFSHKCSNCNFTIREQWVDLYNYCPNCGCDMRGDE